VLKFSATSSKIVLHHQLKCWIQFKKLEKSTLKKNYKNQETKIVDLEIWD